MSTKSSLRAELERRASEAAKGRLSSDIPAIKLILKSAGSVAQPVDFVRFLHRRGLSLKKARDVLERLANNQLVPVEITPFEASESSDAIICDLDRLGVLGAVFEPVDVDVKRVREEQNLSQPDFARLYGLEVDTVRNWEQGRYPVEGVAKVLLNVIEHDPEAVISAIFRGFIADEEHNQWIFTREAAGWINPKPIGQMARPEAPEGYVWVLKRKQSHAD
jgi:putative transcriptional regulator